eukprot:1391847-Amorphochlora_amoeboformis.AAC.2
MVRGEGKEGRKYEVGEGARKGELKLETESKSQDESESKTRGEGLGEREKVFNKPTRCVDVSFESGVKHAGPSAPNGVTSNLMTCGISNPAQQSCPVKRKTT